MHEIFKMHTRVEIRRQIVNELISKTHQIHRKENTMEILALLRQHEPELKIRFGVARIGIFGSFARGEERPDSDVDVLVIFQKEKRHLIISWEPNSILKNIFKRRVDLVTEVCAEASHPGSYPEGRLVCLGPSSLPE